MAKKATAADAQLILKLYELRREAEMRKARNWWTFQFSPGTAADYMKVMAAPLSQENNWMRQVASYWGMAAELVLHGALNEELFLSPTVSGEMFLMYAKLYPFIGDLRKELGDPNLFMNVEKVIMHTKWGRDRFNFVARRLANMRARLAEQNKSES